MFTCRAYAHTHKTLGWCERAAPQGVSRHQQYLLISIIIMCFALTLWAYEHNTVLDLMWCSRTIEWFEWNSHTYTHTKKRETKTQSLHDDRREETAEQVLRKSKSESGTQDKQAHNPDTRSQDWPVCCMYYVCTYMLNYMRARYVRIVTHRTLHLPDDAEYRKMLWNWRGACVDSLIIVIYSMYVEVCIARSLVSMFSAQRPTVCIRREE